MKTNVPLSMWIRVLLVAVVSVFAALSLWLAIKLEWKAAFGAAIVVLFLAPLLLEVAYPGRYNLRSPPLGEKGGLIWSLRDFRQGHPGWDGTCLLVLYAGLLLVFIAGGLYAVLGKLL